jgi:predicted nucleotidyltransferase
MFNQLLERIAISLDQSVIPYMVIGGQAVLIYGEPRLTRDVDITLGVGPDRLRDLLAVAESAGWQVLVENPEEFVLQTMVLPLKDSETGIRMDLIFSFSPYERQAMERVKLLKMGKAAVRFAAIEDVIILKMAAGRPRDLEDVRTILAKNPDVGQRYIRDWLTEIDRDLGKDCVGAFDKIHQSSR